MCQDYQHAANNCDCKEASRDAACEVQRTIEGSRIVGGVGIVGVLGIVSAAAARAEARNECRKDKDSKQSDLHPVQDHHGEPAEWHKMLKV